MGRSQESFHKKDVRNKKEKKRKDKEAKKAARKELEKKSGLDDMIAYVDENGMITSEPPDPTKKKKIKAEDVQLGVPTRETEEFDPIRKGVVSFFNESKGFGFIKDMDNGDSIFVHINNVDGNIIENNLVNFEIEQGPKGPIAVNVKLLK